MRRHSIEVRVRNTTRAGSDNLECHVNILRLQRHGFIRDSRIANEIEGGSAGSVSNAYAWPAFLLPLNGDVTPAPRQNHTCFLTSPETRSPNFKKNLTAIWLFGINRRAVSLRPFSRSP